MNGIESKRIYTADCPLTEIWEDGYGIADLRIRLFAIEYSPSTKKAVVKLGGRGCYRKSELSELGTKDLFLLLKDMLIRSEDIIYDENDCCLKIYPDNVTDIPKTIIAIDGIEGYIEYIN